MVVFPNRFVVPDVDVEVLNKLVDAVVVAAVDVFPNKLVPPVDALLPNVFVVVFPNNPVPVLVPVPNVPVGFVCPNENVI